MHTTYICWTSTLKVELLGSKVHAFVILLVIAHLPSIGMVPIYTSACLV